MPRRCVQREVVSREIRRILLERAGFFDIALDDVSITQVRTQHSARHMLGRWAICPQ